MPETTAPAVDDLEPEPVLDPIHAAAVELLATLTRANLRSAHARFPVTIPREPVNALRDQLDARYPGLLDSVYDNL